MRHVLYANDWEPITVIELAPWAMYQLRETGLLHVSAMPRLSTLDVRVGSQPVEAEPHRRVTIRAELLCRPGRPDHHMLFTDDEEDAMLLRSVFLPGQQHELKRRQDSAFINGWLSAFGALGRDNP